MDDLDRYTREYLRQYDEGAFEVRIIEARREAVLRSIRKHPHDRVLEVGCGAEPLFSFFSTYRNYTVVEPSDEFVRRARERAMAAGNVAVVHGCLEDVVDRVAGHGPFDFIVLSSVLHEVPDPSKLLWAVRRLCVESTVVHINVPNVRSFHRLLALEMGLIHSLFEPSATEVRFQRHTRFDRRALLDAVRVHGFRALYFETYFVKPFTNDQMDRLLRHGIIDTRVVDGLAAMVKHLPEMGCEMLVEVAIDEASVPDISDA